MIYVLATIRTRHRKDWPFFVRDAVAFNVIETSDGESARGQWAGKLDGVVRPKLEWATQFQAAPEKR